MPEILYQDKDIIAINKEAGWVTHPSGFAANATESAQQKLRDQVGQHVFAVHRLDRQTSGVLLFVTNKTLLPFFTKMFIENTIHKQYLAVIRGHLMEGGRLDNPVKKETGKSRVDAITNYTPLAHAELNEAVGIYNTARYTLVEANPETGRWHQIRQHFGHLRHYIIGDKKHGDRDHNRFFAEKLDCHNLLLHARKLSFEHPLTNEKIEIIAEFPEYWNPIMIHMGWEHKFVRLEE